MALPAPLSPVPHLFLRGVNSLKKKKLPVRKILKNVSPCTPQSGGVYNQVKLLEEAEPLRRARQTPTPGPAG